MKIKELMQELFDMTEVEVEGTVDVCKTGDPEKEVKKVAVCCFACVSVLKQAAEWGADLFIEHEPLFFDHYDHLAFDDNYSSDPIAKAKKKIITDSGMTCYRFHDYAHHAFPDLIAEGELRECGLKGTYERGPFYAFNRFTLEEEMNARELAAYLEKTLGIHHIRITGNTDFKGKRLALGFGSVGHITDFVNSDDYDFMLTGEIGEWNSAEYIRDASELGYKKAGLIMSHCGSERAGMKLVADIIKENHPDLEVLYIESPEVYTYTD